MPTIDGTTGPDTLTGTTGDDTISALGGNDTINATSGMDTVAGGTGSDKLVVDMQDAAKFTAVAGAITYTISGTNVTGAGTITSSTGGLNSSVTTLERMELHDVRSDAVTLNIGLYGGTVLAFLGAGDDVVTISGTRSNQVHLGLGSNTATGGGGNLSLATVGVDTSQGFATMGSGGAGIDTISYTLGATTYTTTLNQVGYVGVESGVAGQGYRIDATGAARTAFFADSLYDDYIIATQFDDTISEISATPATNLSTGLDYKVGNGGADTFDYTVAAPLDLTDHILDLDSNDVIDLGLMTSTLGGDLIWLGTGAFTYTAREFRYQTGGGNTVIQFDYNGDGNADAAIIIDNGEFALEKFDREPGWTNVLRIATAQNMVTGDMTVNSLAGTAGADTIRAYDGDDAVRASSGQDFVDGGRDTDTLTAVMSDAGFAAQVGVRTYTIAGDRIYDSSGTLNTSFLNFERVALNASASTFGDTVDGSASPVDLTITTGSGADTITGSSYNDTITPGGGRDTVNAGGGDDTLVFAEPLTFVAPSTKEIFDGGTGFDTLELHMQPDVNNLPSLYGPLSSYLFTTTTLSNFEQVSYVSTAGSGIQAVFALSDFAGKITSVTGGAGRDAVVLTVTTAGTYTIPTMTLTGWSPSNTPLVNGGDIVVLTAQSGGNYTLNALEGLASTQVLSGNSGNDTLNGSSGTDILNGGAGTNTLNGNGGDDVLVIANAWDGIGSFTTYTGAGSAFNGDTGTDTLSIGGFVNFLGTLSSVEAINVQPAFTSSAPNGAGSQPDGYLLIDAGRFTALPSNLLLSGTGTIEVDATDRTSLNVSALQIGGGSNVTLMLDLGDGNGTIVGSSGNDYIDIGSGNKTVTGGAGADIFSPNFGTSLITDFVFGVDRLDFGTGLALHDRILDFVTFSGSDVIFAASSNGLNLNLTLQNTNVGDADDNTLVQGPEESESGTGSAFNDLFFGMSFNDSYSGLGGNDRIYTGGGADTIDSGDGDDVIVVDGALVGAGGTYAGGLGNDRMILRPLDNPSPGGPAGPVSNYLFGSNGASASVSGIETLEFQSNSGEQTVGGFNYAQATGFTSLDGGDGSDVLSILVTGGGAFTTPTFNLVDWFHAGSFSTVQDVISLQAGDGLNYTLTAVEGLGSMQNLIGNAGNDVLYGTSGFDQLFGNGGNDTLIGGAGADRMNGGPGDDVYYVDNVGDVVMDGVNQGTDRVVASVNFVLTPGAVIEFVETASTTGTSVINLSGNEQPNTLTGNNGANQLDGQIGDDVLFGLDGNDTLIGGEGQDWLQGGTGSDTQTGGNGHDSVWGGDGDDLLEGGPGDDTIVGNAGIDTVTYASAGSHVEVDLSWVLEQNTRGAGWDTIFQVENLVGSSYDDTLTGSLITNAISGGDGNDRITGGAEGDKLTGGLGSDTFAYLDLTDMQGSTSEQILDFGTGTDIIDLSAIDANPNLAGDQAFSFIGAAGYSHTPGELRAFLIVGSTWGVAIDADGDGSPDYSVLVTTNHALSSADFVL